MMLGLSLSTFTLVHVVLSLVGIGSGFVVLYGLLVGKGLDGWTALFLATTVAMAPTQSEPPFADAQGLVLVLFIALGSVAAIRFRPEPAGRA